MRKKPYSYLWIIECEDTEDNRQWAIFNDDSAVASTREELRQRVRELKIWDEQNGYASRFKYHIVKYWRVDPNIK